MAPRTPSSRGASRGVFRKRSRTYWHPSRFIPSLLSSAAPVVAAEIGNGSAVAVSTATAKKVVSLGGTCSAVVAGSGVAARKVAQTGATAAAGASTSRAVKVGTPVAPAVVASVSTSTHSRVTTEVGTVFGVAWSHSRIVAGHRVIGVAVPTHSGITKSVSPAGQNFGTAVSTGTAARVAHVAGSCYGTAISAGQAVRRALQAGPAVAAGITTVKFAARVTGAGIALGAPSGRGTKKAVERGSCSQSGVTTGRGSKKMGQAGLSSGLAVAFGRAAKIKSQTGRVCGAAITRSFQVSIGPQTGTRISPPLAIPDGLIAGSLIVWQETLDGGTITVETSIDNGFTWQLVQSGQAIPRLAQGDDRTARTVMTRVTLWRSGPDVPSPRLHRMEVEVAIDSSEEELCPIGVFTLNDTEIADSVRGRSIEISGADLARRVSRNRWDDTYVITEGTNYTTAIQDLIRNRMPDAVFNFRSTDRLTPRLFFGEQSSNDPWQDAQDMAKAIGYELFFDARGICTLREEPDPELVDPAHTFEDSSRPTMVDVRRRVSDENTYNKVVVTGESTSNTVPVRAIAIDDDPSSPTYHLGPYGTVTYRVTNPLVLTVDQAQDAADALLRRVKGATEAVELEVIPMPALEPGDVVEVSREAIKVSGRFLIDQLKIPLKAEDLMRAVGRRQRQ